MVESEANLAKRVRDLSLTQDAVSPTPTKSMNLNTTIPNVQTHVFYRGSIYEMNLFEELLLSSKADYIVVFFCGYDFTFQSKQDLFQIEENCAKLKEYKALVVVVTHDRPNVHFAYATPNYTSESLGFQPSFILVSDSTNRLLSVAFKSIDLTTFKVTRSMHVVDNQRNIVYSHYVPEHTRKRKIQTLAVWTAAGLLKARCGAKAIPDFIEAIDIP
ncbi:hypothetical protein BY458DRAFT_494082 [Sporodiniella umbellata]|nr:hypothetical protein BY458DRAFT_494082 [Sporodiniella umbellata]